MTLRNFALGALLVLTGCTPSIAGFGSGSFYAKGDDAAIHDNVSGEIHAVGAITPALGDKVLCEDASASWAKGSCTLQGIVNLVAAAGAVPAYDTYANCIASTPTGVGDWCQSTDGPYRVESTDGATWNRTMFPGIGFSVTPPPSASWTARNSASVAAVGGARVMTMAVGAGVNYELETRAVPSTPYYLEVAFVLDATSNGEYGPVWFQTSDAKFVVVGANPVAGTNHQDYTNYTTWASHNGQANAPGGSIVILRLVDDGANRKVYFVNPATRTMSQLGADDARTNHITADAVGWGGYPNSAVSGATMALVHWATGTP